jgi:hypothetical protein
MKTKSFYVICLILTGLIILVGSCKKSSDPPAPTPEFPQLVGGWSGFTSGNDSISLVVSNVAGYLKVTGYKYTVKYAVPGQTYIHQTDQSNSSGFCLISGKSFTLNPLMPFGIAADTLNGTFDVTNLTLSGKIRATFTEVADTPVVIMTYAAVKLPTMK